MNNAVLMVIRALACIALVFAGGVIATEVNAMIGCLVSATGLIALAAPLIIETDNVLMRETDRRDFNKHGRDTGW
jgi:hypothetical protein